MNTLIVIGLMVVIVGLLFSGGGLVAHITDYPVAAVVLCGIGAVVCLAGLLLNLVGATS